MNEFASKYNLRFSRHSGGTNLTFCPWDSIAAELWKLKTDGCWGDLKEGDSHRISARSSGCCAEKGRTNNVQYIIVLYRDTESYKRFFFLSVFFLSFFFLTQWFNNSLGVCNSSCSRCVLIRLELADTLQQWFSYGFVLRDNAANQYFMKPAAY